MGSSIVGTSLQTLKLLLPALVPSWRFFDEIAPAPLLEYAHSETPEGPFTSWTEFRPKPQNLSFWQMSLRLFWNPERNESLFLVSCAERLLAHPTQHSEDEIFTRIQTELLNQTTDATQTRYLKFQLRLRYRQDNAIKSDVAYQSDIRKVGGVLPK